MHTPSIFAEGKSGNQRISLSKNYVEKKNPLHENVRAWDPNF